MKVVFCTLFLGDKPTEAFQKALDATLPVIEDAGWEHSLTYEANCPYISAARATVLRKAIDGGADVIMFLDYDVSWTPESMVKILETEGDVIAGVYRKKFHHIEYMGAMSAGPQGLITRQDGCIKAEKVPAGFLKITKRAVERFALAYPELLFGNPLNPEIDMFNHGAIGGVWYGEDYAFSKRWTDKCGEIWVVPDLDIHHHKGNEVFEGNFHKYLISYNKPVPALSNPKVAIVIPSYNYAQYLPEAIESALMQTYENIEVIVVDDGSTDDTFSKCLRYSGRIRYILQENQGAAVARNRGISETDAEWIVCLDADDVIKPTYVEECLQIPDADVISTAMQYFGDKKGVHTFKEKPNYYDFCVANHIHCASMFRKTVWESVGGFDKELHSVYDDWDFWLGATKRGYEVKTIAKPLFKYRKHGASKIDEAIKRHDELFAYIKQKHNIK